MPKTIGSTEVTKMKRIFYSNITYGCNSNCIFCYSHNTRHGEKNYNEISLSSLMEYWIRKGLSENDRVIINGGEPLLHSEIQEIIELLNNFGCEVLIYTNGRLLPYLNLEKIDRRYRFIIPIHGCEELHDNITKVNGSYYEAITGLQYLLRGNCKVDIKIILNNSMIVSEENFQKTLSSLEKVPLNNAVHITKMADTVVSLKNGCPTISEKMSSMYTKRLFDYYNGKYEVKIFDTCVADILMYEKRTIKPLTDEIKVYFKDAQQESEVILQKPVWKCMDKCPFRNYCKSAVEEYKVLTIKDDMLYIGLE